MAPLLLSQEITGEEERVLQVFKGPSNVKDGVLGAPAAGHNVVFAEGVKNTLTTRTLTL